MSEQAPKGNVKNPAIRRIHAVSVCKQRKRGEGMSVLRQSKRSVGSYSSLPPSLLAQDIRELQKDPSDQYHAAPLEVGSIEKGREGGLMDITAVSPPL